VIGLHFGRFFTNSSGTDVKFFLQKIGVFAKNKAKLCKNWIITLVFFYKTPIFRQKLAKIGKNRRKLRS
jgi:hypothetical protein